MLYADGACRACTASPDPAKFGCGEKGYVCAGGKVWGVRGVGCGGAGLDASPSDTVYSTTGWREASAAKGGFIGSL
jgi:hypothetical protein